MVYIEHNLKLPAEFLTVSPSLVAAISVMHANCKNSHWGGSIGKFRTEIVDPKTNSQYLEQSWDILQRAYSSEPGGLHFMSIDELAKKTHRLKLAISNSDSSVLSVLVIKKKHGLKISALGKIKHHQNIGKDSIIKLLNDSLPSCWIEASGATEVFINKYCSGKKYLAQDNIVGQLVDKKIVLSGNGHHYSRFIHEIGLFKKKCIFGTFSLYE